MPYRNILFFLVFFLTAYVEAAPLQTEAELKAIERAHSTAIEIKSDYRRSLGEAMSKGTMEKALPGCRVTTKHPGEVVVGRTSHRLRNPKNVAPDWAKSYLEKFSRAKAKDIPKNVLVKIDSQRNGYLEPIFVEPICLNCHGSQLSPGVQEVLQKEYPHDQAVGFKAGDFRGLLWLEMKEK